MGNRPNRKTIRLQNYDYSKAGLYFLTICVADRKCVLSKIHPSRIGTRIETDIAACQKYRLELLPMGVVAEKTINFIDENYKQVKIEKYCIMPDHIHLIINLEGKSEFDLDRQGCLSLRDVVKYFKSYMTREYRKRTGDKTSVLWQARYYEHIIRNDEDYNEKYQYIENNPLKYILLREEQI